MLNNNRIGQIISFAQLASSPIESAKMAILGFARGHPFNSSDLIFRIGRQLFPTMIGRPCLWSDIQIQLNPRYLGHLISFEEVILTNYYDFKLVPFEPEVVLDCGAHIGLFSLLATQTYPKAEITAFEPNPENASCMEDQLKLNQLKVFFVEAAVSVEEGESWFQADYSNTGALAKDELKNKDGCRVRTIDFPKFLQELNSSGLLLKVDIEGEEARLLPAIIPYLPHKCAIFFESHGGEEVWQKLSQSLMNAQFQVRELRRR
ncbi:MAG: FkbM family methyltransferase [Prochloron sp. SP5CPC1]|nr:FkbM family methyltransferase [Candidatus Paraprochloron terpiosi SP5CPC1]